MNAFKQANIIRDVTEIWNMTKVALVTGSSSGIGYQTSLLLARNQIATYASMRNLKKGHDLRKNIIDEKIPLKVIQLDVDDDKSVINAVDTIIEENGGIDILVNNAGFDMFGPLEDLTIDEIKAQFETNFFGLIRATKAVIPTMRKQHSGTIVNISSLGGRIGLMPFLTAYHASKFAVEGFTESLRQELAEFNIDVVLIEPGLLEVILLIIARMQKIIIHRFRHTQKRFRRFLKDLKL